jgi:ribonuclease HI
MTRAKKGQPSLLPVTSEKPPKLPVEAYTDGGCIGNPGPGGFAAILIYGNHRKELSGGFRLTTNNRMELMAAITALSALKSPCRVTLHTDSQYLAEAMTKGWPEKWKAKGWRRPRRGKALNPDLWERLLSLCAKHEVEFKWIRGHSGNPENERCDLLSMRAAARKHLAPDLGYEPEDERPSSNAPRLFD